MVSKIISQLIGQLTADQLRITLIRLMPLMQRQHHEQLRRELIGLLPEWDDVGAMRDMRAIAGNLDELFVEVCKIVEDVMGVSDVHIVKGRKQEMVIARQIVIFCMCEELHRIDRMTYRELADCFAGHVHHSTIIYARKQVTNYIQCDAGLFKQMTVVGERLAAIGFSRVLDSVTTLRTINRKI